MSSYDILKELSELDEELIMKPRKFVSLRLNVLLCFLSGQISAFLFPHNSKYSVLALFLIFFIMYLVITLFLNRKKRRKSVIE